MAKQPRVKPIPVSAPMPELKDFDRLTVITNIHHEHRGEAPRTIPASYSRLLKEKEEPYQRRFKVTEKWAPVDLGWFDPTHVGCIVIENLEGRGRLVHPTEEDRIATEAKIVEVSYHKDSAACDLIRPGQPDIRWPSDASKLYVRCQSGDANCRISVISK